MSNRLEKLQNMWDENNDVPHDPAEYEWLLEQARSVEDLEKEKEFLRDALIKTKASENIAVKENYRYRQTLDTITNIIAYEDNDKVIDRILGAIEEAIK